MKAMTILSETKSVAVRAEDFFKRIQRNIQKKILDELQLQVEKITDQIFELQDFSLHTNINQGQKALSLEACQDRFEQIIDLEYKKYLLERELKIKQTTFDTYFGDEKVEEAGATEQEQSAL